MKCYNFILMLFFVFVSCKKKEAETNSNTPVNKDVVTGAGFYYPSDWPAPVYNFTGNAISNESFTLGRFLFYDAKLSKDNSISCGSCHQQFAAFAHSGHDVSHGIYGKLGTRNAPALFNLAWHPAFMHDGGINHIEVQPSAPLTNPVEMDMYLSDLVIKLGNDPFYKEWFKKVYGDEQVTTQRLFKLLVQFMGTMVSSNSKFDKVMRHESGTSFTADEEQGFALFQTKKCINCHQTPLFSNFSYKSNGLPVNTLYKDSGRAHITGLPTDRFKFKVPSLRNVEFTAPYMHDGRFKTLRQCLDYYSSGNFQAENLDSNLVGGIPMSEEEKDKIILFLKTLSDNDFLKDTRFKSPF